MPSIVLAPAATLTDRPTDKQVAAWFLDRLDLAPKSVETYRRALRSWMSYLESHQMTIGDASADTVLDYKRALIADHKPSTVNAYLTAVRRLYSALEAAQIMPNIAAAIKGQRSNNHSAKDALSVGEAQAILLDQPKEDASLQELRDYAIVNLLIRRGLRTVEVARADRGDLRRSGGKAVLYVQGKGYTDKGDLVIMDGAALAPITRYLDARGPVADNEPLFASIGNRNQSGRMSTRTISRIAKDALKRQGLDSATLTAHSMRHTAVTLALMGGASLQEVQAMARHRNINTTTIYAHNLDRMKGSAESAVDRILAI